MVRMLVQAAAGSCDRRIYNETTLEYLETRPGSLPYPYPYGFIPGTQAEDGACVDCYLITGDPITAGSMVECEPVGLLLQDEGGEMDHKVLAVLPGQHAILGPELLQELQTFIMSAFAVHLEIRIRVGPILPRKAALEHLEKSGCVSSD
jgi:inorganic pyrophosphatase